MTKSSMETFITRKNEIKLNLENFYIFRKPLIKAIKYEKLCKNKSLNLYVKPQ